MGASMKYLVPYEVVVRANDVSSGRLLVNLFHFRTQVATTGTPAYASALAGPSDIDTFLANFQTAFEANILSGLSNRYRVKDYTARSVVGWTTGGTPRTVVDATNTNPIVIQTLGNHNLRTGDSIIIAGVTGNTAANGTFSITVIDDSKFSIPIAGNGVFTGAGVWSRVITALRLTYGDSSVITPAIGTVVGLRGGEAVPLIATMSVKKNCVAAGRNFRGGLRFSPIAETDNNNGAWAAGRQTAIQGFWDAFKSTTIANGGSDATAGNMTDMLLSKAIAFLQATPFTASEPFLKRVASFTLNQNLGSIVRRKPKMTNIISLT